MGIAEFKAHAIELTEATGIPVEVSEHGNRLFALLRGVVVPSPPFQVQRTDVLFIGDQQYPLSALDMFWTDLAVVRHDGRAPQNGDVVENYLDRQWRRFSWHRNGTWSPSRNGLLDHLAFVEARFAAEAA